MDFKKILTKSGLSEKKAREIASNVEKYTLEELEEEKKNIIFESKDITEPNDSYKNND